MPIHSETIHTIIKENILIYLKKHSNIIEVYYLEVL